MQNPYKTPELVSLTTQDITGAEPITTSLKIAEMFEKQHNNVLRDCREVFEHLLQISEEEKTNKSNENNKLKFEPISKDFFFKELDYIDDRNRKQKMYIMNENVFLMVVMGYTTARAMKIKARFIQAFSMMRHELLSRSNTRAIGKIVRKSLTDAIKDHVSDEGNFKKFAYSNYTKLIYKKVLGMDVKKAKKLIGAKEDDNIRDFLTMDELSRVQEYERKIAGFIQANDFLGMDDREIYERVKGHFFGSKTISEK